MSACFTSINTNNSGFRFTLSKFTSFLISIKLLITSPAYQWISFVHKIVKNPHLYSRRLCEFRFTRLRCGVCVSSLQLPPTVQTHADQTFVIKLSTCDWLDVQGEPRLSPSVSWDWLQPPPTTLKRIRRIDDGGSSLCKSFRTHLPSWSHIGDVFRHRKQMFHSPSRSHIMEVKKSTLMHVWLRPDWCFGF